MFSTFRRKNSKKEDEEPQIRASPSLPELNSQGIPWPESLVDVTSIRQPPTSTVPSQPRQGGAKTSLQGTDHAPIPFHKPFRASPGKNKEGVPISSLYMSNSQSMFDGNWKTAPPPTASRYSQRRARAPPTFNLMVSNCFSLITLRQLSIGIGGGKSRHRKDFTTALTLGDGRHLPCRDSRPKSRRRQVSARKYQGHSIYTDRMR